jgi:hypothetical protein
MMLVAKARHHHAELTAKLQSQLKYLSVNNGILIVVASIMFYNNIIFIYYCIIILSVNNIIKRFKRDTHSAADRIRVYL